MIELGDDRIDHPFQIGEVNQPSGERIDVAAHGDLAAKRMAVHAPALVSFRYVREIMRSFEPEVFDQFDEIGRHAVRALLLLGPQ